MKHTKLPWAYTGQHYDDLGGKYREIMGADQESVIGESGYVSEEDAAYIVQACNAFPDLLEALKETISSLETASRILTEENKAVLNGKSWGAISLLKARAAIAKATGDK